MNKLLNFTVQGILIGSILAATLVFAASLSALAYEITLEDKNKSPQFFKKYQVNLYPVFPDGNVKSAMIQLADKRYMVCFMTNPLQCAIADRDDWVRCKKPTNPEIIECTSSGYERL